MTSSAHEYDHPVSAAKTAAPGEPSDAQSMPPVPAVLTEGLSLVHGDRVALGDVSIRIEPGQTVALIGPNGSGKSTLMNAIAGLHRPRTGRIEVFGHLPGEVPVAYVFQATHVPAHLPLTVREVVRMGRYRHSGLIGRIGNDGKEIVSRSISRLGLDDLVARQLQELSGGQRQRVSLARALSLDPDLLIADEPTSALDVSVQARVLDLFTELQQRLQFACLFISHDLAVVDTLANRVAVMQYGKLVEIGPRDQVLGNPREDYTKRLIAAVPVPDPEEQQRRREERGHLLTDIS